MISFLAIISLKVNNTKGVNKESANKSGFIGYVCEWCNAIISAVIVAVSAVALIVEALNLVQGQLLS